MTCTCRTQPCGCRCYCPEHSPVVAIGYRIEEYSVVILPCELHRAAPNLKNVAQMWEET